MYVKKCCFKKSVCHKIQNENFDIQLFIAALYWYISFRFKRGICENNEPHQGHETATNVTKATKWGPKPRNGYHSHQMGTKPSIVVLISFGDEEDCGDDYGHELGDNDGVPNAVNAKNCWKNEDGGYLENQSSQEGNES